MTPTDEQHAAVEAFRHNRVLKITAFAGAGKTTTLQMLADASIEQGLYLAFNTTIARHAQSRFKRRVDCRTIHSLAWRAITTQRGYSPEKMQGKLSAAALAQTLKLKDHRISANITLSPIQHAHLLSRTVTRFCQSADATIKPEHVPVYRRLDGLPPTLISSTKDYAAEEATRLWQRMQSPSDPVPLTHDGYLKLWAMARPVLDHGFVLLDEAQDTNAVVLDTLRKQTTKIIFCGDPHQQIYEWRNAQNAMQSINDAADTYLTQSFRFGETLAEQATKVLATLGETRPLRGNPKIATNISHDEARTVECILARTNARVMLELIQALEAGRQAHVLGGTQDLKRMLWDVAALKAGKPALTAELFGFTTWDQVKEFAETEEGEELAQFVSLVNQHGEATLGTALSKTTFNPADATLTIGTAHKAKGCEWNAVRLAPDFLSQRKALDVEAARPEIRLFYVAMTRAKHTLVVNPDILETFTTGQRPPKAATHVEAPAKGEHPTAKRRIDLKTVFMTRRARQS